MSKHIAFVNIGNFGSTGKILNSIANIAEENEISCLKCYPQLPINFSPQENDYIISKNIVRLFNNLLGTITGFHGLFSWFSTRKLIARLKLFNPDAIHLHNIHSSYININLLFKYLSKANIKVIWTLHDCWSFTGHCPHFTMKKCNRWKTGCYECPSFREYPQSLIDNSKYMWKLKKKLFTNVSNMTIVTPSQWLADLVKESYLKDYPVKVINNGIDLSVFYPKDSVFREKHGISSNQEMLLGVSFGWGVKKGLDVFIELSKRLDSKKYKIVLVGTNDTVDKQLPEHIISIHRTQNQRELAEIYSAADLFVNPTREENYPTVNMESIACGTPVLTFRTGGSPEILDETCGSVVDCDDVDALQREIVRICETKPFTKEACLARARAFDMNERFKEYVDLYNLVLDHD